MLQDFLTVAKAEDKSMNNLSFTEGKYEEQAAVPQRTYWAIDEQSCSLLLCDTSHWLNIEGKYSNEKQ